MLKVGLTGGIGSGKSTVARVFESLQIPVYYADDAAKRLMQEDPEIRENIIRSFGAEAYANGQLNRAWLSAAVFGQPEKIQLLNSIVHPATIADASRWMALQKAPYTVKEAALIFESGSEKALDLVIGVSAPESIRMQRVMGRDQVSEASVRQRMQNQMDEEEKMSLCNFVIINDESQLVVPQVIDIHEKILAMASEKPTHA